jgi:hypothetical protein
MAKSAPAALVPPARRIVDVLSAFSATVFMPLVALPNDGLVPMATIKLATVCARLPPTMVTATLPAATPGVAPGEYAQSAVVTGERMSPSSSGLEKELFRG